MAWYSWLVLTAIACSRNFDRRPWCTATSFSISRRAPWLAASRSCGPARARRALPGPLVERLLALRLVGQSALRVLRGKVETLERDESFEVSVHSCEVRPRLLRKLRQDSLRLTFREPA